MFDNFCYYFLLFIIYSFMGWLMEIIDNIIVKHKIVNRGFLLGPYCPIYGFGCLSLIFFLSNYKSDPIILFFMAIVICSILEYSTSYIMEKLFKLRWWDYTDKKFNINGRNDIEFENIAVQLVFEKYMGVIEGSKIYDQFLKITIYVLILLTQEMYMYKSGELTEDNRVLLVSRLSRMMDHSDTFSIFRDDILSGNSEDRIYDLLRLID